jgi:hypothetical protein
MSGAFQLVVGIFIIATILWAVIFNIRNRKPSRVTEDELRFFSQGLQDTRGAQIVFFKTPTPRGKLPPLPASTIALLVSPTSGERTEAFEWFDAISSSAPPPYPFEVIVAEGPNVSRTVLIFFFDESKHAPKNLANSGSLSEEFLPWLKTATGGRDWWDYETVEPPTYAAWFDDLQILRQKKVV